MEKNGCLELKIKKIFNFAAEMLIDSTLTYHNTWLSASLPRNYSQGWKCFMIEQNGRVSNLAYNDICFKESCCDSHSQ